MSERPIWLADEPELLALLHAALDRFDQQPGELRQRASFLPVTRHLPSLAGGDATADQTWALLGELQNRGVLRIREARRSVYDPPWQGAKLAFAPDSEALLRQWLDRAAAEPAMQAWRRAVATQAAAFPDDCAALLQRRVSIEGRSAEEVAAAFASIAAQREPITLRQLSARAFWGDSKVLDSRADLIAALFPQLDILDRTIVVAVFLPAEVRGVLFIENQDTYVAATHGVPVALRDLALVYASGFRSSAARIRTHAGALLHYAGPGSTAQTVFEHWWFDAAERSRPCHFWGDLDFAGMQILKALRTRFGEVTAWRPGYESMLTTLQALGGHREGSAQIDPVITGCAFADEQLLPAIRAHGQLDQEALRLS